VVQSGAKQRNGSGGETEGIPQYPEPSIES